jgi:hypothetical protein
MPLDARLMGQQQQSGIPGWMMNLHNAIDPVQALGGYGNVAAMALPMGKMPMMPRVNVGPGLHGPGSYRVTQAMPSGANMEFSLSRMPDGKLTSVVNFGGKGSENILAYGAPTGSLKGGVNRLGEVFQSVESFVSRVRPRSLSFSAGSPGLKALYDRAAPQMAKRLGGKLEQALDGIYEITFPNAAKYPLGK